MSTAVLPLAVTMLAGPQIISAIILVTTPRPVRTSLAFLVGVAAAVCVGVGVALGLAHLLGSAVDLGATGNRGSVGNIIKYVLIGLLVLAALRNWRNRADAEPPKWLTSLMTSGAGRALTIGFLVILLMPSDVVVMLTVGVHLAQGSAGFVGALPFIALTVLIAALPLLCRLLFRRRAAVLMPRLRDWMNGHSWLINIVVCLVFVALIASGG
ncbi:GAP family protein [Streptomyces spiramenti]|uniref:GAP family protein n=1 Tax=Streptomyces spiramenti TaxID=2720606 RepID=A0ABX1AJ35_9ACTN|nr:GAP family protein [Streptomyces spiramenti]NJP65115.1 GAP family protein [Streptomyces spiramenti]